MFENFKTLNEIKHVNETLFENLGASGLELVLKSDTAVRNFKVLKGV